MAETDYPKRLIGAPNAATKLYKQLEYYSIPYEEDIMAITEKITNINKNADNCVKTLKEFNQRISETISYIAKKQIMTSGEQFIEPRINEMSKSLTRYQLLIEMPESNQLSIARMRQRVQKIEESDIVYTMKVRNEVTRIKDMLDKILNKGKQ